jgi:hypothetical protein
MHSTDPETMDKLLNKKLPVFKLHPALLVVIKLLVAREQQVVIFVVLDGSSNSVPVNIASKSIYLTLG